MRHTTRCFSLRSSWQGALVSGAELGSQGAPVDLAPLRARVVQCGPARRIHRVYAHKRRPALKQLKCDHAERVHVHCAPVHPLPNNSHTQRDLDATGPQKLCQLQNLADRLHTKELRVQLRRPARTGMVCDRAFDDAAAHTFCVVQLVPENLLLPNATKASAPKYILRDPASAHRQHTHHALVDFLFCRAPACSQGLQRQPLVHNALQGFWQRPGPHRRHVPVRASLPGQLIPALGPHIGLGYRV